MHKRLNEFEAAEYIGMGVDFLRAGRCRGTVGGATPAPPYYKLGKAVRYSIADLDAWLAARRVECDPAKRATQAAS